MPDSLHDDVKELLDKEKGDERILKQILRACENNEVVSNYERNYVQKLAEKHLGRKPMIESTQPPPQPTIPDVVIPEKTTSFQVVQKTPPRITKSKSKNTKMMLGVGVVSLAIILIVAVGSTGISNFQSPNLTKSDEDVHVTGILLETDSSSYQKKDIISINGKFEKSGTVYLSIENQDGKLVWSEQLKTKNDGKFSTLVIAAGVGWEKSGTFTLKAESDSEIQTKLFSFKA
jgi:hypothetical protein